MNKHSFYEFWTEFYPESVPIGHLLRLDYPERWFRIHSLPESKRYADNEDEWAILLYRQNTLITDLIESNEETYLVTGRYCYRNKNISKIEKEYYEHTCFGTMNFCESNAIDLAKRYPDDYAEEEGVCFVPTAAKVTWQPGDFDELLKKIANDEVHAMFVGVTRRIIVIPYDGGVDCVLENSMQVESCKSKYRNWMSRLESGL